MTEYYNKRMKLKRLNVGDLILCKETSSCARTPQQLETLPKESSAPHGKDP